MTRAWIVGLAVLALAPAAQAQMISFYEANNCRGKIAFQLSGPHPASQSCKGGSSSCRNRNDVARSVRVVKPVDMTVRVFVYDDPYGGSGDDWAAMTFHPKPGATNTCVGSFERNQANPDYEIRWKRNNGLDGKVSYVKTLLFGKYGIAIH